MNEGLFFLLILSLAIGWWLGRYGLPTLSLPWRRPRSKQYLKGFTYLINEQSDAAVDSFLAQLEVTPKTLEMHVAIGSMLRRKGELDRAIRIHQHLLNSPALSATELGLAQMELARDFYSAGILDRVEHILRDVISQGSKYQTEAMRLLIDVYRDLRQWQDALEVASNLRRHVSAASEIKLLCEAMGQYCCEMAEEAIERNQAELAKSHIKTALSYNQGCVRASILAAKLSVEKSDEGTQLEAKQALYKVVDQDVSLFSEAVDVLAGMSFDEVSHNVVRQAHKSFPSHSAFLYLYNSTRQLEGDEAAQQFLLQEVNSTPSLTALDCYLEHQTVAQPHAEVRAVVRHTLQRILARRDRYICRNCGFRGNHMHWLCPKCKRWGEIRQRYGL